MENKSNSLNRIKRQQREKVLRFSIRKYSFGAASVAVAALMFLGARVASADSLVDKTSQLNAGVVNPKDEAKLPQESTDTTEKNVDAENQALTTATPGASTVDKAKLKKVVEELNVLLSTKLNLDESVVSPVTDRLQKGKEALESSELAQKDIDELVELLSKDVTVVSAAKEATEVQVDKQADKTEKPADNLASQTSPEVSASEESQTVSAKKDTLKVSVDQLQAAVLELPEQETSKEVLEKANELLGLAQGVLENTTVSLNDVEDMTKRVKRMFNSVKNATTRLTSGARDSRNGKSMGQGTSFRANGQISSGALANIKYFASVDPNKNGGRRTRNNEPELTLNKTDIKAYYMEDSQGKWIVYDVFFNNDGHKMTENTYQQHYYFQAPFNIMDPSNTVKDLTFTRYRNTGGRRLSDGFQGFEQYGNTATITNPWSQQYRIFNADRDTFYDPNSGVTRNNQRWDVFKYNQDDPTLNQLTKDKNGNYPGLSYYLGVDVRRESTDYAMHMHAKIKLKNNITEAEANAYGRAYAASVTKASGTSYSYIMGATGTRLQNDPDAPKDPIKGLTVTKTVGDNAGDPINPVSSGYVTHKNGKSFPAGMNWTWKDNNSPSTAQAGVFKYKSIATYKDGSSSEDKNSGSDGTVTLNVKPKQPIITPNLEHKKGLPNQQITVNVGNGVPNNSKVNIYDGDRIIGTGTTNGQTATVTVKEPLPGKPLKAETVVTNSNGTVTSDKSNPVTPTEAPDNQPPTLTISPASQNVVEGQQVTFTVTARDDKHVNFDPSDLTTKYSSRLITGNVSATPLTNTDTEQSRRITITTTAEDVGKTNTITFKATDNAGHAAKPVTFTFTVTSRDKIAPTITAADATVTKNEPITPIPVTAVDNPGGVGMRDNNPIEVSNLPQGLKYENGKITGTTNAKTGFYTVKIKAYDKNNNSSEKTIRITVQEQASKYNPTGDTLTVNQGQPITDDAVKAKVKNYAPGTLTVESKPTSTATAGNAGNAVVKVTYSDGSSDTVNVPVTVKDVTGPTITANDTTVTKNEPITPIPVTAVDNTGGVGMRDNNPIQVSNLPQGLKYENGQITGTTNAKTGFYTVRITAYDKNNTPSTKAIRITVQEQASKYNPTGDTLTVNQGQPITDEAVKAKVTNYGPGTLTVQSKPTSTATAGNAGNAVVKVTYPDGSSDTVDVPVTVKDVTGPTITAESATVTKNTPITPIPVTAVDNPGGVGMRDNNPIQVSNLPQGLKYENGQITGTTNAKTGFYTVRITAYDKNNTPSTKSIRITVQDQLAGTATGKTVPEKTPVPANTKVVTPNRPGTTITTDKPVNGLTVDNGGNLVGTPTVDNWKPKEEERTVEIPVKLKNGPEEAVVKVPVKIQRDTDGDGIPDVTDPDDDNDGIPDTEDATPKVADKLTGTVTGKTVPEKTPVPANTKVVTPNKPGTTITTDKPVNGLTVDNGGNLVGTPTVDNWEPKEEERTVEIPVKLKKGTEEVVVKVPVKIQRDTDGDGIPDVTDPDDDNDGIPDTEDANPKVADKLTGTVTGKTVPEKTPVPANTKVITPNKPGTTITTDKPVNGLTVDNGGNLVGTPTVDNWEPKEEERTVEIPVKLKKGTEEVVVKVPVKIQRDTDGDGIPDVTDPDDDNDGIPDEEEITNGTDPKTPTTQTPTIEITQQPNGNAIVTPKKPDGKPYPPGTKVEIPGKDKDHPITVTIGDNGSGEVPNDKLPKKAVPGKGTVTEPNKNPSKPVDVTTPAHKTPTLDVEQDPKTGDVTVTPKRPDGSTFPPGTKVEIPGKDKDQSQ
ncbi:Rib/alpha-like domain-containing protein [Streptococcus sp. k-163]|uniref:Rib/alpha-like domain-containing protein n=1 Tax=Streptococcus sp. k-163 TaxID=2582631 RepID=UPI0015634EB5|nr:Rib/alpha-like domain-containing protein [Streptococcus sp. k-163]